MKTNWLLFVACISLSFLFPGNGSAQAVLDAHVVSERYVVNNVGAGSYVNHYDKVYNLGVATSTEERTKYYAEGGMHSYLFDEDSSWAIRAWRLIDLSHPTNQRIAKGDMRWGVETRSSAVIDVIKKNLTGSDRAITAYESEDFKRPLFVSEVDERIKSNWDKLSHIKLKEDWYYDKQSGNLKVAIIGFGLAYKDDSGKVNDLCWMYYPELDWVFRNLSTGIFRSDAYTWSQFFKNRLFHASLIKHKKPSHKLLYVSDVLDTLSIHRTDLDALFWINELEYHVQHTHNDSIPSEKIDLKLADGSTIKGGYLLNQMHGAWEWSYASGTTRLKVSYMHHKPHGSFKSYYANGQLSETGMFYLGMKKGRWKGYHPNGHKLTLRNYTGGWMDGSQMAWYDDGQLLLKYHYKNHIVHGSIERYYPDGTQHSKGEMHNGYLKDAWEYNIKLPEAYVPLLNDPEVPANFWNFDKSQIKDGVLSFNAIYTHEFKSMCPNGICVKTEVKK